MAGKYVHIDQKSPIPTLETVTCVSCKGTLQVRAKGYTKTLACQYCGTIQDLSRDQNRLALILNQKFKVTPIIPLGKRGKLHGTTWEVIGFMVRRSSIKNEYNKPYVWDEYLLFNPYKGFRWLTQYKGHWNYICSLHNVPENYPGQVVKYLDEKFKSFELYEATVDYVIGEFYWQVKAGDVSHVQEYLHKDRILAVESPLTESQIEKSVQDTSTLYIGGHSKEKVQSASRDNQTLYIGENYPAQTMQTATQNISQETMWSLAEYIEPHEIQKAFGLSKKLPTRYDWAINQPTPGVDTLHSLLKPTSVAIAVLFGISFSLSFVHQSKDIFQQNIPAITTAVPPNTQNAYVSPSFTIADQKGVLSVNVVADLYNSWVEYDIAFINDETGKTFTLEGELQSYSGYSEGEYWHEGAYFQKWELPAQPDGKYHLVIKTNQAVPLGVSIKQNSQPEMNLFYGLLFLIMPLGLVFCYNLFFAWLRNAD